MDMRYKALAVCGGNGVICHPFKKYLIGNIEPRSVFHTKGDKQWELNFGDIPIYRDLGDKLLTGVTVDLIVGAPNCGHSSVLAFSRAKKYGKAKDDFSLNMFIESVNMFRPKLFMMENLPAILKQYTKDEFRNVFSDYELIFHECSVSAFGNSQKSRVRLILIGIKKQYSRRYKKFFKRIYAVNDIKTTRALLGDLIDTDLSLTHVRENDDKVVCMTFRGKKLNLREVRKVWQTEFKGSTRWLMPESKMKTLPGVYRNVADETPATVRGANRQFNHRGEQLSPRECARIQNVPDNFMLWYDPDQHEYCINKARVTVAKSPPYDIALWLKKQINKSHIFKP